MTSYFDVPSRVHTVIALLYWDDGRVIFHLPKPVEVHVEWVAHVEEIVLQTQNHRQGFFPIKIIYK